MRTPPTLALLATAALTLGACANQAQPPVPETIAPAWGTGGEVVSAGRLYFAGQPSPDGLKAVRESGVNVVIDLRGVDERRWDEAAAAKAAGLAYHHVPVPRGTAQPYSREGVAKIEAILADNPDANVLVHCASGSRVAGWYAIYLAQTLGLSTDEAIDAAGDTGLLRSSSAAAARAYLSE
ncbi:MAG: sulfur transferase domain-containing protein [Pseudomonadota bacterium]